jgi:hypothetical protein
LGADRAIDYANERFEEVIQPVDAVLDLIGRETLARSYAVIKHGRHHRPRILVGSLADRSGQPSWCRRAKDEQKSTDPETLLVNHGFNEGRRTGRGCSNDRCVWAPVGVTGITALRPSAIVMWFLSVRNGEHERMGNNTPPGQIPPSICAGACISLDPRHCFASRMLFPSGVARGLLQTSTWRFAECPQ